MATVESIGVESRFAVLNKKKKKPKKEEPTSVNGIKKPSIGIKQGQAQNVPKKKPQTQPPLIGLSGNHISEDPEEKKKRKKKKKLPNQTAQWDEWKQKDAEVVDKEFDKSLQEALALSKLEAKRRLMVPAVISTKDPESSKSTSKQNSDTIHIVTNGNQAKKKADKSSQKLIDNIIDSQISQEKLKSLLEVKEEEVANLQAMVEKLHVEMKQIKLRNKTLCTIISEGELKSKADLILELEASSKVKEELVSEVNRLNILLEQERSKLNLLTAGERNSKEKNKKNRQKSESEKYS